MVASAADRSGEENPLMFSDQAIYIIFTSIVVSVLEIIDFKTSKQKESMLFLSR